ncbi:N-acetylglucosamine-6-phosphate deacetylase [Pontibacillus salicampi]|uniref:N-acetylglucosamine-6-phosphate deacetylase n=1 Tax=Pontibacillus salicampi TaxID=1449801 RepID=A0ABV6LSJ7_9BACI
MRLMLLTNGIIYAEDGTKHALRMKNGKIVSFETGEHGEDAIVLPDGYQVLPGFLDLHIHGAGGADTMDATPDALATIARRLAERGTTGFLATTITQSKEQIEAALANVASYQQQSEGGAAVLGIHLEGPFISPKRAGAQPTEHIQPGSVQLFQRWQQLANGAIRLVTLAPEEDEDYQLTTHLQETGVVASIGHSDATFDEVNEAVEKGISHATHLFNQMRGLHHREPGVAGAVFLNEAIRTELITDGMHVSPPMVQLSFRHIGAERLILITDAMRAQCMPEGKYELGGQEVFVEGNAARLADGTLAGSILTLSQALHNVMEYTGCTMWDVIQMASTNPAKELGIENEKGSIAIGKDADLVVLDEQNEVYMTIIAGEIAYQREEA